VEAFLERKIGFLDIVRACEATMRRVPATPLSSLADALDADREARAVARELLNLEQPQALPA
jgi:1-deoxy-D-xylulose 5-phosphate reductoisomerase